MAGLQPFPRKMATFALIVTRLFGSWSKVDSKSSFAFAVDSFVHALTFRIKVEKSAQSAATSCQTSENTMHDTA
jgi:hypothetical protein